MSINQTFEPCKLFQIELVPPNDPKDYERFYNKHHKLFELSCDISLTSHRLVNGLLTLTGFERNYNFAKFLQSKCQQFKIMFHITCFDVNIINIEARFKLLKELGIEQILIITGDGYEKPQATDDCPYVDIWFENSSQILRFLKMNGHIANLIKGIAIAAYPTKNNIDQECNRIVKKIQSFDKVNIVYLQCLFRVDDCVKLKNKWLGHDQLRNLPIIPSVATINDQKTLDRVNQFIDMDKETYQSYVDSIQATTCDGGLVEDMQVDLVTKLVQVNRPHPINICLFGNVNTALKIMTKALGAF